MDKWEANESKDYLGVFSFQLWTEFKLPEVYKKSGGQINSMLYSGCYFIFSDERYRASLVAQAVKNLPVMQETRVQSLDLGDPLEEAWQPTPVLLPGEFQWQRSLVGYSPWGSQKVGQDWVNNTFTAWKIYHVEKQSWKKDFSKHWIC